MFFGVWPPKRYPLTLLGILKGPYEEEVFPGRQTLLRSVQEFDSVGAWGSIAAMYHRFFFRFA